MRRSRLVAQVFSDASTTSASIVAMSSRAPYRGSRGRGRGQRSFSDRPYNNAGRDQFVTADSHFQSVHDANLRFRHGEPYQQPQPPVYQQQQPPFNPNYQFRPPPPSRGQWQQFHQPNQSPSNQNYAACPPPPPFYQNQMSQPPPQRSFRQRPRSKPSDYREWEYAKTALPPGSEKFVVLSYNILADYLANDHWRSLYFHIPRNMLSWGWRKSKIVFELGLWSADIMCLQEVDKFQDLEEDLKHRGYSGIWKMRTGNAVDGCAIFWRSNRFKLVHEESIQFNQLGLRDNVAQICVLETLLTSHTKENEASPPESSAGSCRVVICNIHVLFNPKRGDFKLGQVRTLLDRAHAVSKLWDDAPVVLCGDFNCTPKSHLYNFISERKLDLSGLARDKVSGQVSAEIRPPRPEIYTTRFQSANKSPQGQVQPPNSITNAHIEENNSYIDVGKGPSKNTSELPCGDTILAGHEATSSSDRVLPSEDLASDCNLGKEDRKPDASGDLSVAEDLSLVTLSDTAQASSTKVNLNTELSGSSVLSVTEQSPEEIVSSDQNSSSSLSTKVDTTLSEIKLGGLTLDEPVVFAQDEEDLGEDGETFLAKLHDNNEDLSQKGEHLNEFSHKPDSEAFNNEKIMYNPSSWTPMEIATATGNPERTTVEHALELKSTYSEVEGQANTRDENGEPVVTSYHRCFMGTVDYIWRSEGLQTVRVLAPIPKQAMQWTPGFPTPKWGSDHIALVSELAFCSSKSVLRKIKIIIFVSQLFRF
ncbi:Carbon catabolite repressor-like protein [Cardamine amara subsp. amara]|uniref:Carbon catabolite repressor-like protein n=1 Tax=Cardamine amara subsp. amara TaxID=228776 RepID=A0ABD1AL82_CARAN